MLSIGFCVQRVTMLSFRFSSVRVSLTIDPGKFVVCVFVSLPLSTSFFVRNWILLVLGVFYEFYYHFVWFLGFQRMWIIFLTGCCTFVSIWVPIERRMCVRSLTLSLVRVPFGIVCNLIEIWKKDFMVVTSNYFAVKITNCPYKWIMLTNDSYSMKLRECEIWIGVQ